MVIGQKSRVFNCTYLQFVKRTKQPRHTLDAPCLVWRLWGQCLLEGRQLRACTVGLDLWTLQWASIQLQIVLFLYTVTQHPAAILSCGKGGGVGWWRWSASMTSVLDPFQLKCGSFKMFFVFCFFFLNKLQSCSLSAKPRATAPVEVQEPSVLNTICNVLLFFLYVQNVEMFLKLNKQYYIF